jgi:hypothetical protein
MQYEKAEIHSLLKDSCDHHLSMYIKLRHQPGEILTVARQIIGDIVIVEPVSLQGVELPRTSFYIQEIESVTLAKVFHNATLYAKLRDLKGNIRSLLSKDNMTEPSLR